MTIWPVIKDESSKTKQSQGFEDRSAFCMGIVNGRIHPARRNTIAADALWGFDTRLKKGLNLGAIANICCDSHGLSLGLDNLLHSHFFSNQWV